MSERSLAPADTIGGQIKVTPEDFIVEEIPAYLPCGEGEHLYLWVQKRDVSAELLESHLARTLGISRNDVGVAGLKDRRAVTRQWVSVPASAAEKVQQLNNESIQVLRAEFHSNKLRTGHLNGNRFEILIRSPDTGAEQKAQRIADRIRQFGIPNRFGDQRFGNQRQTLELGLSLLRGESSAKKIPFQRRKFLTRLSLSAVQSDLFNLVLNRREEAGILHEIQSGDVMQLVDSGAMFLADDASAEQARFDQREIIPTGPLYGPKMKSPAGRVLEMETQVLEDSGLTLELFHAHRKVMPGGRRPLLIFPRDLQIRSSSDGVWLHFSLPAGAYATVVLEEFTGGQKSSPQEPGESEGASDQVAAD